VVDEVAQEADWYLGTASGDTVKDKLQGRVDGSFAVRDSSSQPGNFVLSYSFEGALVGAMVGALVGALVGVLVGAPVGVSVGDSVGVSVGAAVGAAVVGAVVGTCSLAKCKLARSSAGHDVRRMFTISLGDVATTCCSASNDRLGIGLPSQTRTRTP